VGGGSVHFTGNYWRFHESDFHERSVFGNIPGTAFEDWPIRYADLEPYYTKAEYDIGVSGVAGANPFEAPRSKPYPLPPLPVKSSGVLFERATKKLGLHPFPAPMAILSQPYRGRSACVHCGFCESFGCEMRAKSSTLVSVIPVAESTGRCEIRPNSYVRKIATDAQGRGGERSNLLRREPARDLSAREGSRRVCQRSGIGETIAAFEIGEISERPCQFEWRRG
jgi:choline dehydrogenase-like flavoprotein